MRFPSYAGSFSARLPARARRCHPGLVHAAGRPAYADRELPPAFARYLQNPELALTVTLTLRRIDLDAAILSRTCSCRSSPWASCSTSCAAKGRRLHTLRTEADIDRCDRSNRAKSSAGARRDTADPRALDSHLPLIGFAGAPRWRRMRSSGHSNNQL